MVYIYFSILSCVSLVYFRYTEQLTLACILGLSIFLRGKKLPEKEWLTVEDIHELLDKSVPIDTIRAWIRTKKLPAYRPGKAYLVRREDFEQFIRESRTKPD
jgi:excisionase family DNA binding protein